MDCQNFRVSLSGYNKQDVDECLDKLDVQIIAQSQELTSLQQQCAQLEHANQALTNEKAEIQKSLDDYTLRRDAIIRLELDAQLRADQLVAQADATAEEKVQVATELCQKMELDAQGKMEVALAQYQEKCDGYRRELQGTLGQALGLQDKINQLTAQFSQISQSLQGQMDALQQLIGQDATLTLNNPVDEVEEDMEEDAEIQTEQPTPPTNRTVAEMFEEIMAEEP